MAGNNDLVPRGSLVGSSGDMFYITNTHCLLTLSGVNIVNNDADGALLRVVTPPAAAGAPPAATAHRSNSPQTVRRLQAISSLSLIHISEPTRR